MSGVMSSLELVLMAMTVPLPSSSSKSSHLDEVAFGRISSLSASIS
jgi:hypothetical protein